MSLKEYRRKRRFERTPEPTAEKKTRKKKKELLFVVQKHAATRTHYDFRLEVDGVLKSWAVPKGPTLTSQAPRLAVFVEDHPIEYGSFEGVIPKGNYGAGTVMLWDQGHYLERNSQDRKESEKAIRKGLEKGHITFVLYGEKLRGEFALIRLKKKGAPDNGWLLIKKQDAFASRKDILEEDLSVKSARSMQEISEKALQEGEVWIPRKGKKPSPQQPSRTSLKKENRKPMPHRIKTMQAVSSSTAPPGIDWIFENCGEGPRAIAEVSPSGLKFYSRMFLPFEKKYPLIARALKDLKQEAVFDGEIIDKGGNVYYSISDLLYCNSKDLRGIPLEERKQILSKIKLLPPLQLTTFARTISELKRPSPFLVAKKKTGTYESKISKLWIKFPSSVKEERRTLKDENERPPLTHLNKIFFPQEKYTKEDIVKYYESVADYILPHLKDRPQSLHRQPNGISDPGFFHKDMTGFLPRRIPTVKVHSSSAKKTVHYLLCQDKWSLLYLVNWGCIELNPWLSRKNSLENPDYVVIDLDPDGNPFRDVVRVALEIHHVLDSIGAKSFCKTSGGTGLHICIPTGAEFPFETSRLFAEDVCRVIHQKFPSLTSLERTPAKRRGRIYLDYLQNRRGQTLAAPYCIRPRPHAPVSTPLEWSEVKPGLKPENFTLRNTLKRLRRVGDLWKPLLSEKVDIEKCHKLLLKIHHI